MNGVRLELRQDGNQVIGELAAPGGACPGPVGAELLRGSLLDDSLAAQVRLCLVSPSCKDDPGSAFAVLLVTTQLTGGVHSQTACAAQVRALTLRRPGPVRAPVAPLATGRLSRTPPPAPRRLSAAPSLTALRGSDARAPEGTAPREATAPHDAPASTSQSASSPQPGAAASAVLHSGALASSPPAPLPVRTELDGPDALLMRGLAELHDGRYESARKLFREAVRQRPDSAEAYNGVGVTFYARGDYDEALAWYKRALEADPRFGDAYYNMACLYAVQGHKPLALRYLRLAALNRYSDQAQLQGDPDLISLRGDPGLQEIVEQMSMELKPSSAGAAP